VVTVRISPAQTVALAGFFEIPGATGSAATVQETSFDEETSQPLPVAVRRLCTLEVPVTAVKEGTVELQEVQVPPLSVL
jgi:hypothetical protein